jgi:hypothetical protein
MAFTLATGLTIGILLLQVVFWFVTLGGIGKRIIGPPAGWPSGYQSNCQTG